MINYQAQLHPQSNQQVMYEHANRQSSQRAQSNISQQQHEQQHGDEIEPEFRVNYNNIRNKMTASARSKFEDN